MSPTSTLCNSLFTFTTFTTSPGPRIPRPCAWRKVRKQSLLPCFRVLWTSQIRGPARARGRASPRASRWSVLYIIYDVDVVEGSKKLLMEETPSSFLQKIARRWKNCPVFFLTRQDTFHAVGVPKMLSRACPSHSFVCTCTLPWCGVCVCMCVYHCLKPSPCFERNGRTLSHVAWKLPAFCLQDQSGKT